MVKTKNLKVRFNVLTPEISWILYNLEKFHRTQPKNSPVNLIISEISSDILENSRFYIPRFVKIQTRNFRNLDQKIYFCIFFEDILGVQFDVLFENRGTKEEHILVRLKKGIRFSGV